MEIKTQDIAISRLQPNSSQIEGLPKNPRKISKKKLEQLKKSVQDAPEMLRLRELIAVEHDGNYVVICGNQRLEAAKALKMETLPVKVLPADTPVEKLREYAIKDNLPFGEDDWEVLTTDWDVTELEEWGMEIKDDWEVDETPKDYTGANKELDVEEFDDRISLVFSLTIDEHAFVRDALSHIDANKENALLKLLGYGNE